MINKVTGNNCFAVFAWHSVHHAVLTAVDTRIARVKLILSPCDYRAIVGGITRGTHRHAPPCGSGFLLAPVRYDSPAQVRQRGTTSGPQNFSLLGAGLSPSVVDPRFRLSGATLIR
ncbi:hypothetical protein Bbelb_003110 [Branchiostoma belcheri]|nr:hypothetical protein Bbelb_003110 [Branchiostoma belcheri]